MFEAADTIVTTIDDPRSPEDFEDFQPEVAGPEECTRIASGPHDEPFVGLAPLLTIEPDDEPPTYSEAVSSHRAVTQPAAHPAYSAASHHQALTQPAHSIADERYAQPDHSIADERYAQPSDFLREDSQPGWGQVMSHDQANDHLHQREEEHESMLRQRHFDDAGIARARAAARDAEEAARLEAIEAASEFAACAQVAAAGDFDVSTMPPLEEGMEEPSVQVDHALFATGTPHPQFDLNESPKRTHRGYVPPSSLFATSAPAPSLRTPAPSIRDLDSHRMDGYPSHTPRVARAPGRPDHYNYPPGRDFESADIPAYYAPVDAALAALDDNTGHSPMAPAYEESSDLPWFVRGAEPQSAEDKPTRAEPPRQHFPDLPQTLITIPPEAGRVSPYHSIAKHAEPGESSGSVDLRPGGIIGWLRRKVRP